MNDQEMILNIRYYAPQEIWEKIPFIYAQLHGWLGFSDGEHGQKGIPYWFGYDDEVKHISASVEPGGLQFCGLMEDAEWQLWVQDIKRIASRDLGYKVGEIALGEVDE